MFMYGQPSWLMRGSAPHPDTCDIVSQAENILKKMLSKKEDLVDSFAE